MSKKLLWIAVTAIALSLLLALAPWVATFYKTPFSTSPADWGVFGDYFGGVLSVSLSAFGLVALIYTLKIQNDAIEVQNEAIKAQLAGIQQDKDARDDEVYSRQSIECLNEAYNKLINSDSGLLHRNRINWLESARLILTAGKLSHNIKSKSVKETYAAAERVIRSRFNNLLEIENVPETIQPAYFTDTDYDRYIKNLSTLPIEKTSVFVIYRFASWRKEEVDLIAGVQGEVDYELIDKRYFGARQYIKDSSDRQ